MNDREIILSSIKEALKKPSHRQDFNPKGDLRSQISNVLPATGNNFEENLNLFKKNSDELKTDFYTVKSIDEIVQHLERLKESEQWKSIATHSDDLFNNICSKLSLPVVRTNSGYDVAELEKCAASITECDCLVAQTGSVIVSSNSNGGRAISVLPPHHIIIAKKEQLLPSMPDAIGFIKRKYSGGLPSMISIITGPSRTGDIERILVLGAHGPKKLTVFLIVD
ncbi:MAG: LutC/YkgG family protein [Verrucomicrobiia bacterium]